MKALRKTSILQTQSFSIYKIFQPTQFSTKKLFTDYINKFSKNQHLENVSVDDIFLLKNSYLRDFQNLLHLNY